MKKKIDFKYNLKLYFKFLRKHRSMFILTLFFVLVVEASRVVDKFLFKEFIDQSTDFSLGLITESVLLQNLLIVAIVFAGVTILKAIFKWLWHHMLTLMETRMIADMKRNFFNHIISLSYNFHTTHKTGSLISRLVRGGRAIEKLTDILVFNVAPLFFQLIMVVISLWFFDWLAAITVLITVIIYLIYSFILQQMQRPANMAANDAEDLEKAHVSDMFMNVDSIKYFGKEKLVKRKFRKVTNKTSEMMRKHWNYFRWLDPGQSIIMAIGTFLMLYFPLLKFLNGEIGVGTLTFVYLVFTNLWGPLFGFVHGMREFYRVMADFESLFQYKKINNEIKDAEHAKDLTIPKGRIEFQNIDFAYHKRKIFRNFTLEIPKNKKVALVGHSGCGKTSLIRLLYRLYDVNKGSILIDGQDISQVNQESLRAGLSMVPQECILFDDTIYNNIAFSRPKATRKEVLKAMKFAQLDTFIKNLPLQEKTIVGERGVKLSGGEKQRVSIARAILANKKILVLDEATSALDSHTENEIQQDLERLMVGRTSIIIAHRLSTIMKADEIVVMDKGRIVQKGNHQELIKVKGAYKKLWNLQKGGYIK